ncbi:MAG: hypothetical protein C4309_00335 [Chloroflexota bacterium]
MRVYVDTLGCRLNQSEIESLARQFERAGHTVVRVAEEADLCVVNTCAVTGEAEQVAPAHPPYCAGCAPGADCGHRLLRPSGARSGSDTSRREPGDQ